MRRSTRQIIGAGAIAVGSFLALASPALGTPPPPNPNQVEYWCAHGIKYEPVATPFVVPAPPNGFTWTLLVLKAGSEQSADPVNETFSNPVVGQSYSRTDGKDISHAILCKTTTTTTTQGSTTTAPTTTSPTTTYATTTTEGTTTTLATTTTEPTTTTSSSTTIATTTTEGTTTTTATTLPTTTTAATTTVGTTVPSTTQPAPTTIVTPTQPAVVAAPTELPVTGSTSPMIAGLGLGLVAAGGVTCLVSRKPRTTG